MSCSFAKGRGRPHARNVDTAADDQVVTVGPVVNSTTPRRGKVDDLVEAFLHEPGFQLGLGVMRLVPRGVPVEVVADAEGPVGVSGKVGDLVQRPVDDGNAAEDTQPGAKGFEHTRGEPGCDASQARVEPFLGRRVLAVEPDRQASAGLDFPGDLGERPARVGRVMEHADREDQVEGGIGQGQVEKVGLDYANVRKPCAQRGRLVDGRAQVNAEDPSPMAAGQTGIATTAATAVEHELARKIGWRNARLDLKRCLVFLAVRHVVAVPLPAKALCIRVAGKPRYPPDDRIVCAARRAIKSLGRIIGNLQCASASRTRDQ